MIALVLIMATTSFRPATVSIAIRDESSCEGR